MISAKDTSLWAQIAAAVVILVGLALKGLKIIDLSMGDVLMGAAGVAGVFSPVYANLIIDKVKGGKE
jgi:hypothetical protein